MAPPLSRRTRLLQGVLMFAVHSWRTQRLIVGSQRHCILGNSPPPPISRPRREEHHVEQNRRFHGSLPAILTAAWLDCLSAPLRDLKGNLSHCGSFVWLCWPVSPHLDGEGPAGSRANLCPTMNTFTTALSPLTQPPRRKRFSELLAQALHVHLHVSRFSASKEAAKQRRARIPGVRGSAGAGATRYLPVPGAPFAPFTPGALGAL